MVKFFGVIVQKRWLNFANNRGTNILGMMENRNGYFIIPYFLWQQNDTSHLKLVNSNRRQHRRYERENDIGMSMIKDRLARADRRITSVKAGQKLADYLIKEDEEKVIMLLTILKEANKLCTCIYKTGYINRPDRK